MIGLNNDVERIAPSISINDEAYSNRSTYTNRPTLQLDLTEPNNNTQFSHIENLTGSTEIAGDGDGGGGGGGGGGGYCNHAIDQINGNFMCLVDNVISLTEIPISALRPKSREMLSKRLNATKVILSENGAPRDWRGVLNSIGLSDVCVTVQNKNDPMKEVLELWSKERKINATIGNLQQILGNIDRWDVVDDTNDLFVEDSKYYLETVSKSAERKGANKPAQTFEHTDGPVIDESNILTRDDIDAAQEGRPQKRYDAYLLFANDDIDFATTIVDTMERDYGLTLCLKERDLIGGTIENDAIMRMISERCNRLIVIFSKAFFDSPLNTFLVKYAQMVSLERSTRKIVPLIYEECTTMPDSFKMYFALRYQSKVSPFFNFWEKLHGAIITSNNVAINRVSSPANNLPKITITEDSPSAVTSIDLTAQSQRATVDYDSGLNTLSVKRKDKSKSSKSSPTTPTSLKKLWANFPKIGSQSAISTSMWTLGVNDQIFDKENERCHSSLSLNNARSSPTPTTYKKTKWYKKLLSPASTQKLSAESDSSVGPDGTAKKKKWYRKRFHGHSKTRQAATEI